MKKIVYASKRGFSYTYTCRWNGKQYSIIDGGDEWYCWVTKDKKISGESDYAVESGIEDWAEGEFVKNEVPFPQTQTDYSKSPDE